jgi:hypothetical protein
MTSSGKFLLAVLAGGAIFYVLHKDSKHASLGHMFDNAGIVPESESSGTKVDAGVIKNDNIAPQVPVTGSNPQDYMGSVGNVFASYPGKDLSDGYSFR